MLIPDAGLATVVDDIAHKLPAPSGVSFLLRRVCHWDFGSLSVAFAQQAVEHQMRRIDGQHFLDSTGVATSRAAYRNKSTFKLCCGDSQRG
ncbi:hypothetical protein KCP70_24115 [Salmonella enterica subsp. enterica]|nr:hypothetical protein KCP70_24115 [Salmonella enterica subsp. enterica]